MATLWIVDRGSPREALAALPASSADQIIVYIETTTALAQLIAEIRQRVQTPVGRARIVSHGNSGQLNFSNGIIRANNVQVFQFLRGLIRPAFAAGIELHGCGVASDFLPPPRFEPGIGNVAIQNYGNMEGRLTGWGYSGEAAAATAIRSSRGVVFLQAMANACGVCVRGGVDYQLPDSTWQYEGPTITVCPGAQQVRLLDPRNRFGLGQTFSF
jgi:hypothetical protein